MNLWSILRPAAKLTVLLSIFHTTTLFAQQVTLRTETTSVGRLDVVVHPFTAVGDSAFVGDLPQSMRDLLRGDLEYSGYFNLINSEDLPPDTTIQVRRVGNTFDTLRTFTGSQAARIHGSISFGWEEVTASIAIFQPPFRDPIHLNDFHFQSDQMRFAAHNIAGWVTEMLTGEQGAYTSKIVFVVKTGQNKDLWMMDWDGANAHSLTRDQTLNLSPTWSPDGKTIYFTSFRAGNADVYKYDLESGQVSSFIATPKVDSAPSVSLDGQWIAFASSEKDNFEIFRIHPDGSNKTRITFSSRDDTSPSWSPTGREIVFTSDRGGSPQIYIMDVEGIDVRRLSFEGVYNETPRWSPRGDLIAFCSRESNAFPRFQIFTISPNGGRERRLTDNGSNFDPCWSPDGMKVIFTSQVDGKSTIWTCNWDGSNRRQLTFGLEASQPSWGPSLSESDTEH
ncbi:Tol-Pal system beta propeller repeat protein TolB [bacterium]|nr:Tol-Pal system beta propeller repeat protein TolB [bacterium]MBU1920285.1 Tol-Pal system beta propeller repeat protein TolB [bacterium]